MKEYQAPEIEISEFSKQDIIVTSPLDSNNDSSDNWGPINMGTPVN